MSPDHAARCSEWIEEQLTQLANLRNASPRDPSFKLWRQNTLTVLQRVWPGEPARSERFRRIPFSPGSTRADGRMQREWFSRGCAETNEYLRALIDEIAAVGVPSPEGTAPADAQYVGAEDVNDYPVLDLSSAPPPARVETQPDGIAELDLDRSVPTRIPRRSEPAPEGEAPPRLAVRLDSPAAARSDADASEPQAAPPRLPDTALRPLAGPMPGAPSEPAPKSAAGPRSAAPGPKPAAAESKGARTVHPPRVPRVRKPTAKPKLKQMLGLGDLDRSGATEAPAPEPAAIVEPVAVAPVVQPPAQAAPAPAAQQSEPVAQQPEPAKPEPAREPVAQQPEPAKPEPAREPVAQQPEPAKPEPAREPVAQQPEPAKPAPAPVAQQPAPAKPAPAREPVAQQPEPAKPAPAPVAQQPAPATPELDTLDDDAAAHAAREFLRTSPVLGLQGRPVTRIGDSTPFLDPDAVALATLATDVARHGVPESRRTALRAELLALAQALEQARVEWPMLREVVTDAMEYPDLARRLLPVVLTWFDRAA